MKKVEGYMSIDNKFFETEQEVLDHELELKVYHDFKDIRYRSSHNQQTKITKNCLEAVLKIVKENYVRIPEEDLDTNED